MINKNVLIIFLKYPVPGTVKTRLAKSIGEENAEMLYKCFVQTILANTKSADYETIIFFTPQKKHKQIKEWLGKNWNFRAQKGTNLGERLSNAFGYVFKSGAKKVVVIGSDSPLLDDQLIKKAFSCLDKADCVIGPSSDGGYYLLGLKRLAPELFDLKEWSTNVVFEKTRKKALNLNMKLEIMEEHFDVDEKEDLIMLEKKLEHPEYSNNYDLNKLREQISNII